MEKYRYEVIIQEWSADDSLNMPLSDFLTELNGLAPGDGSAVFIRLSQSEYDPGDYGIARLEVYRYETDAEVEQREAREVSSRDRRQAEHQAREMALFQELKRKYGQGA